jgi:osmotically inducible protein OsmC
MPSPRSVSYTASAISTGDGRNGHVRSSDGFVDLDLRSPGADGSTTATNPEQLFAAGYAACFHSALRGIAKRQGLPIADDSVTAEVGIGKYDEDQGTGYGLKVTLLIELSGISQQQAEALAEAAHQTCPYSNATRGNIDVTLQVEAA